MEDYKQEIRNLILAYYEPSGTGKALHKSTIQILEMCQGVIPDQPITQHDIYEVMKELGFKIELVGDEEYEKEFRWLLYDKNSSHTMKIVPLN